MSRAGGTRSDGLPGSFSRIIPGESRGKLHRRTAARYLKAEFPNEPRSEELIAFNGHLFRVRVRVLHAVACTTLSYSWKYGIISTVSVTALENFNRRSSNLARNSAVSNVAVFNTRLTHLLERKIDRGARESLLRKDRSLPSLPPPPLPDPPSPPSPAFSYSQSGVRRFFIETWLFSVPHYDSAAQTAVLTLSLSNKAFCFLGRFTAAPWS